MLSTSSATSSRTFRPPRVARSAWLAGLIAVAVRPAIDGAVPIIIVEAPVRGSGKGLMVDVAAIVATGRPAARIIYSRDDAEIRKAITAVALVGDPLVLMDNVSGELGCPSLDAALTADTWRDRVLGASTMTAEIPLQIVWWATGNGLVIGADFLSRRALLVRLEPDVERPEERTGWRYPRLLEHVRNSRAELLGAALTYLARIPRCGSAGHEADADGLVRRLERPGAVRGRLGRRYGPMWHDCRPSRIGRADRCVAGRGGSLARGRSPGCNGGRAHRACDPRIPLARGAYRMGATARR